MAQNDTINSFAPPVPSSPKETLDLTEPPQNNGSPPDGSIFATREGASVKFQELTGHILKFLSNATNETLGVCIVGLGAMTYLVLGRVGLVLIGVVGGVVLHATWEENNHAQADESVRASEARSKKERGLDIITRLLDWRDRERSRRLENDYVYEQVSVPSFSKDLDFSDFQSATGEALTSLTDAVIRDYVKWWFSPLLPLENSFPLACRQTFVHFFLALSSHLSRKRPADVFLDFLTNSSAIVIVFFNEFSSALMGPGSSNSKPSEVLYKYLETNPDCNLANVLDVEQQEKQLQAVAEDILHTFLDSKAYNFDPVKIFLREVLAGLILETTVQSCSRPEWINGWIVYLLEGETEILNVIDAGVGGATTVIGKESSVPLSGSVHLNELCDEAIHEPIGQLEHKRNVSRAESAMEEAMQEAKRLSELIAAEEARKEQNMNGSASSETTTVGNITPTSSQSGLDGSPNDLLAKSNDDSSNSNHATNLHTSDPISSFTDFDQIVPSERPLLTLYNAKVSIFDDSQPGEKATIRAKPAAEYLLQIEPLSSQHPGWMIARKYTDFETLHEVLRRISVVSGVPKFAQKHGTLPGWKNWTKASLRSGLELYLQDALSYDRLAESEGMKRFLEKDQVLGQSSPNPKSGFGFPSSASFETMGKGMLDVLTSAPKGAAGGGKAILGGVTGVLGGVGSLGQKKQAQTSGSDVSKIESISPVIQDHIIGRESHDSIRNSFSTSSDSINPPPLPNHLNLNDFEPRDENLSPHKKDFREPGFEHSNMPEGLIKPLSEQATLRNENELHLPPPPSEIPNDYKNFPTSLNIPTSADDLSIPRSSTSTLPTSDRSPLRSSTSSIQNSDPLQSSNPQKRENPLPLTEKETQVAVELFFAVINELYTLSSAWNIRRTLLNAAKSFLLRPGNPNLEAIRLLLQDTMIEANTSDAGLAAHLTKLRENTLPTEEELKTWPPPPTDEEKEKLRAKARKLLVEKGMPQALTSVMGAAASGESLGRVFDCLQVGEVARGLMFALILKAVKAATQ